MQSSREVNTCAAKLELVAGRQAPQDRARLERIAGQERSAECAAGATWKGAPLMTVARVLVGLVIAGSLLLGATFVLRELITKGIKPAVSQQIEHWIFQRRY